MSAIFPAKLIDWAGHGRGGVRQPFVQESGRPTGGQIVTPLVQRLNNWANDVAEGKSVPRIVLLVGGPGNGKTDAIEGCIESLDRALGESGRLIESFKTKYRTEESLVPPRKVVVTRADRKSGGNPNPVTTITLVQDATEEDFTQPQKTAEQLLLDDLLEVSTGSESDVYLCCVNRGILAAASRTAAEQSEYGDLIHLIATVSDAVTSRAVMSECWPLADYPDMAIWPMDVESLVDHEGTGISVAHQIFEQILQSEKWADECVAGDRCPFCENQRLLSRPENLNSLIVILHRYELASGKRWSFRDLFSLIAYLLVGDFSELKLEGQQLEPCDWAAKQLHWLDQSQSGERNTARAPFLLASKIYYHRLFPLWPRLNSKPITAAMKAVKTTENSSISQSTTALFDYLRWSNTYAPRAKGDVADRVRSSLTPALDPALILEKDIILYETKAKKIDLGSLEDAFSASIEQGLELLSMRPFSKTEKALLLRLQQADEDIGKVDIMEGEKRLLRAETRQFAMRFVKRSLAARRNLTKDTRWLDEFSRLNDDNSIRDDIRKTLRNLLQEDSSFKGAVATTFGQPVAQRAKDVVIKVAAPTRVKIVDSVKDDVRPKHSISFVSVQGREIGLTFDFFKALRELSCGLHEASLSAEVFALLDRVKAAMTGRMIRGEDDERTIILEGVGLEIAVEGNEFFVQKASSA